jgi:hypothetical protein
LKFINKQPKKLSELNDINRLKEIFTEEKEAVRKVRQNITIQKVSYKIIDGILV